MRKPCIRLILKPVFRRNECYEYLVNKEFLDDLYEYAEKNSDFLLAGIELYVEDTEIKDILKEKVDEIIFYIKRAYNPELVELKQLARIYYQAWLRLKDIDDNTAKEAYFEYLETKRKIDLMQMPF